MASNRQVTSVAATTETAIVTADPNYFLDIHGITVANRSVTDGDVIIRDSVGGTIVWRWAVKAGSTFGFMLGKKDGVAQSAKNQNWTIVLSAALTFEITTHFVQRA